MKFSIGHVIHERVSAAFGHSGLPKSMALDDMPV